MKIHPTVKTRGLSLGLYSKPKNLDLAPVVQGTEQKFPKLQIQVRILAGALKKQQIINSIVVPILYFSIKYGIR